MEKKRKQKISYEKPRLKKITLKDENKKIGVASASGDCDCCCFCVCL